LWNVPLGSARNVVDLSTFRFEPQNFEQGIMNIEVMENLVKLHNSIFLVQYSTFNKKRDYS
jgi:hypothetical protein